jgi:hypothetical protein
MKFVKKSGGTWMSKYEKLSVGCVGCWVRGLLPEQNHKRVSSMIFVSQTVGSFAREFSKMSLITSGAIATWHRPRLSLKIWMTAALKS